jgi:hypothetical protein
MPFDSWPCSWLSYLINVFKISSITSISESRLAAILVLLKKEHQMATNFTRTRQLCKNNMVGGGKHLNAQANRLEHDNKPKQAHKQTFFLFQLTEANIW